MTKLNLILKFAGSLTHRIDLYFLYIYAFEIQCEFWGSVMLHFFLCNLFMQLKQIYLEI